MKSRRSLWSHPELWLFGVFLGATIGILVMVIGAVRHDSILKTIAIYLMAPFAVGMALVTLVLLPRAVYFYWRRKKQKGSH